MAQAENEQGGRWDVSEVEVSTGVVELRPVPVCRRADMRRASRPSMRVKRVSSQLNGAWQPVTTVSDRSRRVRISTSLDVCS